VDLVHHLRPCIMRSLDELSWVPQGERDGRWLCLEGGSEGCFVEQRHHVVDRERPRSDLSHAGYLPLDALGRVEDGADAPKAASLGDRRNQFWGCRGPDRCLHNRNLHINMSHTGVRNMALLPTHSLTDEAPLSTEHMMPSTETRCISVRPVNPIS
jgi:hypothetical protein